MSEFVIALLDLLEAEGRSLKQNLFRTGAGLAYVSIAAIIALGGILMCIWAGYQFLEVLIGPILAALSTGVVMLFVASLLIWSAIKLSR